MTDDTHRIGFMQGRLSPQVNGKIQAFPWADWRQEFAAAQRLGLGLMEWTLDHERLAENPLMTDAGRREILELSRANAVRVGALTGDLFMQAPFWKTEGSERADRLAELDAVLDACGALGIREIVVPLVDNGSVQSTDQSTRAARRIALRALAGCAMQASSSSSNPISAARELADFIAGYPPDVFGINYDTGNSAALGFDAEEELAAYHPRILHVHIKDRLLGGTTVPLGTGNADLPRAVRLLEQGGYSGDYVLQTARAVDGDHAGALGRYRAMTLAWLGAAR